MAEEEKGDLIQRHSQALKDLHVYECAVKVLNWQYRDQVFKILWKYLILLSWLLWVNFFDSIADLDFKDSKIWNQENLPLILAIATFIAGLLYLNLKKISEVIGEGLNEVWRQFRIIERERDYARTKKKETKKRCKALLAKIHKSTQEVY